MQSQTVAFSRAAANVFLHVLTQCNLACRHCYINPQQHGTRKLPPEVIEKWLADLAGRHDNINLVLLGGEPTLHPDLPLAVRTARRLGYASVTIDTNGYLFNNILERVTPDEVDYFSFSLDGATPRTNDALRGEGTFDRCTAGIARTVARGFRTSLIYTVSRTNLEELGKMPELLSQLGVERFFIQVIGLRGQSAALSRDNDPIQQVTRNEWLAHVPPVARTVAARGITVTYPKVYLSPDETFECAGNVAHNYFIFPNGRVYQCPLCEDYPIHSLTFQDNQLLAMPPINEADLFALTIPEGCVMNRLIQPKNIDYTPDGTPSYQIACCLLKEEIK